MKWLILLVLTGCTATTNSDIGHKYLGAKYINDPLGEETFPDTDPLIRTDAFDCTTFVETAISYGNLDRLTQIRYKNGEIDFLNRNHFIETDWLQNNKDLLSVVSGKYGSTKNRIVTIDKKNWLKKVHNIDANFLPETVLLEYIPYDDLENIKNNKTLIVLFIAGKSEKNDKIGTDIAVTHMGFLMPNGILRHASSQYGKVMDTNFYEYAEERAKNKHNLGIILVEIK